MCYEPNGSALVRRLFLANIDKRGGNMWSYSISGADGCVWGIPCQAQYVVRYDPENHDEGLICVGPKLHDGIDDEMKWSKGVLANNGCIYCLPLDPLVHSILKINTQERIVSTVKMSLEATKEKAHVDETWFLFASGVLADDGCIYYMPAFGEYILKLDPTYDSLSSVGPSFGNELQFIDTVNIDGIIYGVPASEKSVCVKFYPNEQRVEQVESDWNNTTFHVHQGGVFARDNFYYSITSERYLLKIDVREFKVFFLCDVGSFTCSQHTNMTGILGCDGNIYWPLDSNGYLSKYDIYLEEKSNIFVQPRKQYNHMWNDKRQNFFSGACASNGVIYCIPFNELYILAIDPMHEFKITLTTGSKNEISKTQTMFKKLFHRSSCCEENSYEYAIRRYSLSRIMNVVNNVISEEDKEILPPFIYAASFENSSLDVIYLLVKRDLSSFKTCEDNRRS